MSFSSLLYIPSHSYYSTAGLICTATFPYIPDSFPFWRPSVPIALIQTGKLSFPARPEKRNNPPLLYGATHKGGAELSRSNRRPVGSYDLAVCHAAPSHTNRIISSGYCSESFSRNILVHSVSQFGIVKKKLSPLRGSTAPNA